MKKNISSDAQDAGQTEEQRRKKPSIGKKGKKNNSQAVNEMFKESEEKGSERRRNVQNESDRQNDSSDRLGETNY